MMETFSQTTTQTDHSNKTILARGCDPTLSAWATKALPPQIGNPKYVATTNDVDFVAKLKERQWSVVYFAPGACRFSAANMQIPGGNAATQGWTLDEYKALVHQYQGEEIKIVESTMESNSLDLLREALETARVQE